MKGYLTHIDLSNARMYAKMDNPTDYQKRQLVRLACKLGGICDRIDHQHKDFEEMFNMAKKYFNGTTKQIPKETE
jgi:hypothetical protein